LRLHAVRSALYAPVFLSFAWLEPAVGSRKDSLRCWRSSWSLLVMISSKRIKRVYCPLWNACCARCLRLRYGGLPVALGPSCWSGRDIMPEPRSSSEDGGHGCSRSTLPVLSPGGFATQSRPGAWRVRHWQAGSGSVSRFAGVHILSVCCWLERPDSSDASWHATDRAWPHRCGVVSRSREGCAPGFAFDIDIALPGWVRLIRYRGCVQPHW